MNIDIKPKNIVGYTIIEIMMVLLIIGTISLMAYPSFENLIQRQKVDNLTNNLYLDIKKAKNLAIMNNKTITIESIVDSHWTNWRVKDNSSIIFRKGISKDAKISIVSNVNYFSFNNIGQIKRGNIYLNQVYFKICHNSVKNKITINSLGKMNVEEIDNC